MIVLGISAYFHDSAAALVKDGAIIAAAEEERFNRIKHYNGFPTIACKFCLEHSGVTINDVDKVVFYEKPFLKFERIIRSHINYAPKGLRTFLKAMPTWLKDKLNMRSTIMRELKDAFGFSPSVEFCHHHLSHAALSYYTSPYESCAILVIDAVGEDATTSIIKATRNSFEIVENQVFPHSLGLLYSAFTYYLGFKVNSDEYKVMGLAPYGDKKSEEYKSFKETIVNDIVTIHDGGNIELKEQNFAFMYADRMVKDNRWQRLFGIPKRKPNEPLTFTHANIALAIQDVTEEIMLKMARYAKDITGEENLCVVGGCALNCAAIGKLYLSSKPGSVYVPYAPGDDGAAIGCALIASGSKDRKASNRVPYWGPSYSDDEVRNTLVATNLQYEYIAEYKELCHIVAQELANSLIIGWFQGRMEFGPRALGNRSILADPRQSYMKNKVNAMIKFRESFRPFAPAVLAEHANDIFECDVESTYMSTTFKLKRNQQEYPAITHVDNTSRIQTVSSLQNEKFYELLNAFYELTGCPLLLNTSFNVMGEPIVCSPSDAIRTFTESGIDILVINNFIIRKQ
ncbi:MAG: carbamoyltransferase C-terminal domain-containing protein [Prevotella sp.]|uniref:carbamoyltransferase family protein n=1 Tax=Prevotella sp. TaxID=59823 RepID=UPI002A270463|nr:carbamoyltransferase C-terminal domain-containing protein [Prevotella sp.]MDD7318805.1 carbamoyltransferase C-terminal domain-containing protein [Prevotellaceae bacterium]MDY4019581.1 carbamoyltransferase C-terminal domain-containing protein [Prevotella sp.]